MEKKYIVLIPLPSLIKKNRSFSLSLMCNRNKTKYDGRCTAHVFHLNVPITNSYLHGCAFNDLTL